MGQVKRIKQSIDDAIDRLIKESLVKKAVAQRFIENGDQLPEKLLALFEDLGESADEEPQKTEYGHSKGFKPLSVKKQKEKYAKDFPDLDTSHIEEVVKQLPLKKGKFKLVVPKSSKLGGYHLGLEAILDRIGKERNFYNYRKGQLGPDRLRLTEKTKVALEKLEAETPGDFIVLLIQDTDFVGFSVEDARKKFKEDEVGLDPLSGTFYMWLHPDRISGKKEESFVDLAGGKYAPHAGGDFSCALCFGWGGGELCFGSRFVKDAYSFYGSASASLP